MTNRHKVLLRATILLSLPAAAPAAAQDGPDLRSLAYVSGRCERMSLAGRDYSATCRGPVTNVRYQSGRTSFAFPTDAGLMVSFSGEDLARDGERLTLRLDRITIVTDENPAATTEAAEGVCAFADFDSGPVTITCAGRTNSGDFVGIFASDGKPPSVESF
jgi:hypothetical protein